jgi:electron transport complex protein RnfG
MSVIKNDMLKMVVSLVLFSTVACVALAFVYDATKPTIDGLAAKDLEEAQRELFPDADSFDEIAVASSDDAVRFDADTDSSGTVTRRYQWAAKKDGRVIGVEIRAASAGFQSDIRVLTAVGTDGKIKGVKILHNADTPGLGLNAGSETYFVDKQTKTTFYGQFAGLSAVDFTKIAVHKDGGGVAAITAATISSRTVSRIVSESARQAAAWLLDSGSMEQGGAQ